ncbi:MAG: UDP-N-acetylglucosamine diphosphorylase/glucosamine-1-phosphate N-acetyltransferase [Deltaproteobacteria bacterium]|nr:UDP-N-acetylglucosamine diphosphorylase/glucosamine-1-phosphate N-acetyltransferase [Deltaproteobacteria bacterium]
MKDVTAIVLAAGLGTRMKSELHKGLHELAGRPLLFYPIRAALDAGIKRIVLVVGHQAQAVEETVEDLFPDADIGYVTQERQLGTAHAAMCARGEVEDSQDVVVLNGDLPLLGADSIKGLMDACTASGGMLAITAAVVDDPFGFGRVVRDKSGIAARIVEERDAGPDQRGIREINLGVYAARAGHLFSMLDQVGDGNAKGEFYFTDVVELTRKAGHGVGVYVLQSDAEAMQVNDRAELAAAEAAMYQRKAALLMSEGVTIHQPGTVMIDDDCEVGRDTEIWPCVELHAGTRIGSGCVIGRGCVLDNTEVADDVTVLPYSVMTDSSMEDGTKAGPFSHLRPGSVMKRGSKVGNFVEMKKSTLGPGSKSSHLTYLGDSTIGADVNIGAGTITCNYDGVHKMPTTIEDGAFIGSDTQLVAPVKVGRGAYVGAGTTVTRDVPDGALALSRVQQTHIMGYAMAKKKK